MFAIKYSVCIALAITCASARPDDKYLHVKETVTVDLTIDASTGQTPTEEFKEVLTEEPKEVATNDPNQVTPEESKVAPTKEGKPEPTESPTEEPADTIPVNEKYPSAVLYGGTCGGTIISPTWILTAAHCTIFGGGSYGYVLAGTNNTDDGSGVTRNVKRQIIHPLFSVGPYWVDADEFNIKQVAARWDFMLAELTEPLPLDGKTMVVAKIDEERKHPAGEKVGFAGYGTNHFGGYMRSDMHEMQLEIQADEVCSKALEQYNAEDMICTRGRQPRMDSACSGDSGSGLMDEFGNLLGATSWVEKDAQDCFNGALVVFSRVASVRDWIREVTKV